MERRKLIPDIILSKHSQTKLLISSVQMIKYAHNTYDGRTQKIPSEDTLFYFRKRRQTDVRVTANDGACWVRAHTL